MLTMEFLRGDRGALKKHSFLDAKIILLGASAIEIYLFTRKVSFVRRIKLKEIVARIEEKTLLNSGRKHKGRTILERKEEIIFEKKRIDNGKEEQYSKDRNQGSYGAKIVPGPINIGIIGDTPWHGGETEKMHREESEINTHKGESKMNST